MLTVRLPSSRFGRSCYDGSRAQISYSIGIIPQSSGCSRACMEAGEARRGGGHVFCRGQDLAGQRRRHNVLVMSWLSGGNPCGWDWKLGPPVVRYCNAVLVPLRSSVITYYYPAVCILTVMLHLFVVIGAMGTFEASRRIYAYHTPSKSHLSSCRLTWSPCTSKSERIGRLVLDTARCSGKACMCPNDNYVERHKVSGLNGRSVDGRDTRAYLTCDVRSGYDTGDLSYATLARGIYLSSHCQWQIRRSLECTTVAVCQRLWRLRVRKLARSRVYLGTRAVDNVRTQR